MYNDLYKKTGVSWMSNESEIKGIGALFCVIAGNKHPEIALGENHAKSISAVHVHSYHDEEKGMLHDIRAVCDFGNGLENTDIMHGVKGLGNACQNASSLASYNENLRVISGNPYLAIDPDLIEKIEPKEDGAYFTLEKESSKLLVRAHIAENQLASILEKWSNPDKGFPKVVVHEGNVAKAQFGQDHYDKRLRYSTKLADVIPLRTPE